ncbi:MAG: class I SAM-dependent methyltransferase [Planctomycetota bacterium]
MDRYTQETCRWLELRFHPEMFAYYGREYDPYQPLHGVADGDWGPASFLMASRLARLLAQLRAMRPSSFLDVGGAEGWVARMVGEEIGIPSASVDLSHQAAIRAREFSQVPAAAVDSARLPFKDDSFDVVFLSEVLEHLANPVRSLLELRRVAKRAIIVTTEAFAPTEAARRAELDERELEAHMDRSIFCPSDFDLVFKGYGLSIGNQCSDLPAPYPQTNEEARLALHQGLSHDALDWPAHGIVVVADLAGPPPDARPFLAESVDIVAKWYAPLRCEPKSPPSNDVPKFLMERLRCPVTGSSDFAVQGDHLVVGEQRYLVAQGAPRLTTSPGEPSAHTLEQCIAQAFPDDASQLAALTELAEKLHFELPSPDLSLEFLKGSIEGWDTTESCQAKVVDGEVEVVAPGEDPKLISPRVLHKMADVAGFVIEIAALDSEREVEECQLYWYTLEKPVWWEFASAVHSYPADGKTHRLEFEVPDGFETIAGDELLQLRIDPLVGKGCARIQGFEIILK